MSARLRIVAALLAVLLAACGNEAISVHDAPAAPVVPPEDAHLADGGWPETAAWIRRELAQGRPVIVNVFASWCVPCRREMPLILAAARANPEVAFLGIDHLDQRDNAERFVGEFGIDIPTIYDVAGDVAAAINARGMPTTVAFARDGRIVAHRTGEVTASSLDELVSSLRG